MAYSDLTPEFRLLVKKSALPDAKRGKPMKARSDAQENTQSMLNKEYLREAYNILNHICNLNKMLSSIRKAYLNTDLNISTFGRPSPRTLDVNDAEHSWSSIRTLTNEERDQIDLQARIILSKCADRVRELEALEKKRTDLLAQDSNIIMRILPSRLKHDASAMSSANVAAHHAGITNYLNRLLTLVGQAQADMQEERIKRQSERARTLGSGAAQEAANMGLREPMSLGESAELPSSRSWLEDTASNIAHTIGLPSSALSSNGNGQSVASVHSLPDDDDDDYDDMELSASQIQQFESENANILRSVQETLVSVQQAESRLMEISALQTELVAHLAKQTEVSDQLFEDAVTTTTAVEKGNEQLREAKRRIKDGRLYILVFLTIASLSLLFLHYY